MCDKRDADNKAVIKCGERDVDIDDRWVVSYNAAMLLKYECHKFGVVVAYKSSGILFKYITKAIVNEVENAAWRVLEFYND